MAIRTVKYFLKDGDGIFSPLACSKIELGIEKAERGIDWCPECNAYVELEGKQDRSGIYSTCIHCGTVLKS